MQELGLTLCQYYGVGYDHGKYSSTDEYSTSSDVYRGFGYYHHIVDIAQPPPSYYSNAGSSNQSSQPSGLNQQIYYYPYGNYIPSFYTYHRDDDNDDFVSHRRNSM